MPKITNKSDEQKNAEAKVAIPATICAVFAVFVPAIRNPCKSALVSTSEKLRARRDARRKRRTAKSVRK
jgi:hypothetical protein